MKAFPKTKADSFEQHQEGMDLRDYFAAKAMQGLLTQGEAYLDLRAASYQKDVFWEYVAEIAYNTADAMMESRKHDS